MKTIFKKSTANWGCYKRTNRQNDYIKVEDFTIKDFLDTDIVLKDKAWFIRHNCELTDTQFREFAIGCALCVLPIYESKYPDNKAPRKAIEASQAYLLGTINIEELRQAKKAAAADAYAADAAAAAYAAYAAAAAATDAYAADAYAADAATDAAAYAAAAAAKNNSEINYKELLLQFFREFTADKAIEQV